MIEGSTLAKEARARLLARVRDAGRAEGSGAREIVAETLYEECRRIDAEPDRGDARARADRAFVERVRRELAERGDDAAPELLELAVSRYADEIEGSFRPTVYRLSTRLLPTALNALLHGATPFEAVVRLPELPSLDDRVLIDGEVETLKKLARVGTVVLAPTHVSNLDSVLLGYAIFRMGLPPFIYGAGLNLFESKVLGFFMRNLGAYTIDRRKTDPLYKALLKEYATAALLHGQHALFFPGGTRSRSGAVERRLKKGLLGTTLTASRERLARGASAPRVFVFPCTISYPLVLEASGLVESFLARAGGARYVPPLTDESDVLERWARYFRNLLALDLDVHLRIAAPLDAFGCSVRDDGCSLDPRGHPIDPGGYVRERGVIVEDDARDAHYTRLLEAAILRAYRTNTIAVGTAVVSFAALHAASASLPTLDVFHLLARVGDGSRLPRRLVVRTVERLLAELRAREDRGEVALARELRADAESVIDGALATFATYHRTRVLSPAGDSIAIGDARLLFYYRNRLDALGLLGTPSLLPGAAT